MFAGRGNGVSVIADAFPVVTEDGKLRSLTASAMRTRLMLGPLAAAIEPLSPRARLVAIEQARGAAHGLRYLACALPEREAIWWACMCDRHVRSADHPVAEARVIAAAEGWVRRPDEAARAALLPMLREADARTPASFIGRAVFRSRLGDPASLRAAMSVGEAVRAASDLLPERLAGEGGAAFRRSALDIAAGGAGWITAAAGPIASSPGTVAP